MSLSSTEERYLKAIYQQGEHGTTAVSTNTLAASLHTSPAAVTDMVQKLHEKELVIYQKYQGVTISSTGKRYAIPIIRKHFLWEVFLVEKLQLGWEKVHAIAEQLEHIHSPELTQRLDDFLGKPAYSPHGKPIPNAAGEVIDKAGIPLTAIPEGSSGTIVAIKSSQASFLQYLNKRNIYLGARITVVEKLPFDESVDISVDQLPKMNISQKVGDNILIIS